MPALPADARIGDLTLTVPSLSRSLAFYTDVLGFVAHELSAGRAGLGPRDGGEVLMATDPLDLDGVTGEPGADEPWQGLEHDTVIGHVHLHVPDLAEAERFYCEGIGFTPMLRRYPGVLFVAAGGYHHHLGLNVWAGRGVPPPPPGTAGLDAFTIEARGLEARTEMDVATNVRVVCRPAG